jgi:hypothetical protein
MRGAPCKDRGPRGTMPGAFLPYVAEYYDLLGIMQPGRLTKAWTTASLPLSQSVGSKTVVTRKAAIQQTLTMIQGMVGGLHEA